MVIQYIMPLFYCFFLYFLYECLGAKWWKYMEKCVLPTNVTNATSKSMKVRARVICISFTLHKSQPQQQQATLHFRNDYFFHFDLHFIHSKQVLQRSNKHSSNSVEDLRRVLRKIATRNLLSYEDNKPECVVRFISTF